MPHEGVVAAKAVSVSMPSTTARARLLSGWWPHPCRSSLKADSEPEHDGAEDANHVGGEPGRRGA
jgi:hypothetical protein